MSRFLKLPSCSPGRNEGKGHWLGGDGEWEEKQGSIGGLAVWGKEILLAQPVAAEGMSHLLARAVSCPGPGPRSSAASQLSP